MTELHWLQEWYLSQCDGEWEHEGGVMIDTIDNPGWKVEISLKASQTEQIGGKSLTENASESDWIICKVVDGKFLGVGDPAKLTQILAVFRSWLVDHG